MVRPEKMYRKKNPDDFYNFKYEDLEMFIEKPLFYDGSKFLILYVGRFVIREEAETFRIETFNSTKK